MCSSSESGSTSQELFPSVSSPLERSNLGMSIGLRRTKRNWSIITDRLTGKKMRIRNLRNEIKYMLGVLSIHMKCVKYKT